MTTQTPDPDTALPHAMANAIAADISQQAIEGASNTLLLLAEAIHKTEEKDAEVAFHIWGEAVAFVARSLAGVESTVAGYRRAGCETAVDPLLAND